MRYLLAIDLEMSGLVPGFHEITQVAAIALDKDLNNLGGYKTLVHIDYPKREKERRVHKIGAFARSGINPADLENTPSLERVIDHLLAFIKVTTGLKAKELREVTLFGQNTKADFTFLEAAFTKLGKKWPFDYHNIDLASLFFTYYILKFSEMPERVGLDYICDHFGIVNNNPHDAMSDITCTIAAFKHILSYLKVG